MDEDIYNRMMSEEHERLERQVKAFTRGCGMMFLIIAVVVAVIMIFIKLVSV